MVFKNILLHFIIFKYHLDHFTHVIKDLWGLLLAKLKFSMVASSLDIKLLISKPDLVFTFQKG